MAKVENSIPILRVESLARSLDFYERVLGFKSNWQGAGTAGVSRDAGHLMLCEGAQGSPGTWVWIGVEDIEPLHADFAAKGARVQMPPTNFPWAYEMRILDQDGHVLRFGSEPRLDRPAEA